MADYRLAMHLLSCHDGFSYWGAAMKNKNDGLISVENKLLKEKFHG
jgi:hypothetical protein